LTGTSSKGDPARLAVVTTALDERRLALQAVDRTFTDLKALQSAVADTRRSVLPQLNSRLRTDHRWADLGDDEWSTFIVKFSGDVDTVVDTALQRVTSSRTAMAGSGDASAPVEPLDGLSPEDLRQQPVAALEADVKRLQHLLGLDDSRAGRLLQVNEQLTNARSRLSRLDERIGRAENVTEVMEALTQERSRHYAAYFDAVTAEEAELKALYAPLDRILETDNSTAKRLQRDLGAAPDRQRVGVVARVAPAPVVRLVQRHERVEVVEDLVHSAGLERRAVGELVGVVVGHRVHHAVHAEERNAPPAPPRRDDADE